TFKGPGIHREITFNTEGSVVELKSRQLAALRLAGVSKIRCNMVRVSPYLVPEIAQAHKKHKHAKDLHIEKKTEVLRSLGSAGKLNPVFVSDDQHDSDAFVSPEAQDAIREFSLPLSFRKNPDRGGAWLVSVTDADGAFTGEAAKLIQITDMAISYKLSQNSLLAWVTSLHTGLPVPTAELLLTQSDGHVLFLGKTDPNGVLLVKRDQKFPAMSTGKEGASSLTLPIDFAKATWLVAATPTDSCALEVTSSRLSSSAVSQTKKLKEKPDFHTGQVFTERGVYRPGETVYFKFVSREYEKNSIVAPAGQKIRAEITNPLQEVVYSKELTLGEFGSCHDSFATKKFFPVGTYTVTVSYMPDEKKAEAERFTTTFMVQEFKKIRHFTTLSVKKAEKPDSSYIGLKREEELLLVEVKGQYYTGGPVKNGQVRWKATLVPVTNTVPGFDGYVFGNQDTDTQFLESGEATLDKDGKLQLTIPLDTRLLTGIYGIQVSATVLDIDGEPATEVETYNPKLPYLVGVANHPRQVQSGYSAPLKAIVVDNDGKKVPSGTVKAIIMRQSYYYVQKRDEHGNINSSYEQGWAKSQATDQQIVNGEATLQTQLFDSGAYLIELVYEQDGARFASRTYFNVGWQEDYEERERRRAEKVVPTSNEILVSMSKKEYRAGDPAVIQFSTPRPVKKSLITLEKGEILEYHVVDVSSGTGTYQFTVKEQFQPNVYVSVMAAAGRDGYPVYASQVDTDIPMVYFGYADISVRSAVQKLKLDIEPGVSELRGRPGEKKTLNFRVTEAGGKGIVTEMAVCVVDEAILALTRFQTPELSALTKFNLPLAVFSGDLRLNLMSQDLFKMLSTRPLTGGGMGLGEVNPSLRKDFRPVAYFNPAVVTDASGRATVEFTLPDTTTAYRVYAVVCDKTVGFVSGQRNMVVTKEFFIEPSLPRFLIPGDSVTFPISVNNKTKEKGEVDLQIKGSAELKTSLVEPRFRIEPLSGMVVKGTGQVLGGMEKGVVTTEGKFSGDQNTFFDAIEQTIPIHSRFLPVNAMKMGSFKTKAEIPASLPQALKTLGPDSLNPEDFRVRLSLSLTNWSRLAPGLKYLLAYPYGCIEQTSSGIIPLAGIRGLIQSGTIPGISVEKVDKFLQSGIERLLSMQLASGGFSYWPGETDVSWWGTQYATYALVTARDAGFTVPPDRLEKAFKFIRDQVFSTSPENGTRIPKPAWTQELALLNISESDLLGPQDLDQFFKRFHSLKNQDKAFLLIAAKKVGYSTPQKLAEMFGTLDPKPDLSRTNYYDSTFRELAACLMAAVELRIAPQKADAWAGLLLTGLKPDGRWQSTADTGWCLLALSKYYGGQGAAKAKSETVPVRVSCGGRTVEAKLTDVSADVELDTREVLQNPSIRLESDGSRLVNYILYLTYPDVAKDPSELSRGFHLTKRIENLNGQDEIRVGDVLRVTLNISVEESLRKSGSILEYAALEDPVPAGIVPINPELKTEGVESEPSDKDDMFSYDGAQFRPNFSEFRDDGVRVFKNKIWPSTYTYSYL
ncbi:MAG TPA: MG2 domain-containing protein, partial [Desulfomonilaceae bacterium]|nr:MG2 domain-containing protein [Desulfomonilaceae bacterium]